MEKAKCLLCGGPSVGSAFPFGTNWGGRRFDYLRCGDCGSSFIDPLPTAAEFAKMYDRAAYHDEYYADSVEEDPVTFLSAVQADLPAGGTVLDFGCGNGGFLRLAARAGFDSVGVELEENARRSAAANSGRPVFALETLIEQGRRFDVIHLGDVLEHLPDPTSKMRQLESLLAQDGRFFLEGPLEDNPSTVAWSAALFGRAKRGIGRPSHGTLPPFHLFRTTARAQRAYFKQRLGYRVERFLVDESGWPYWNAGDRLSRPHGAGHFVKMAIGRVGIGLARATAPLGLQVGNRFAAVLQPTRHSANAVS